ncbi:(d)CMP kinase [Coraliomargarita sp. SDUM461003]|uniref:Cytidylate kinase n=1 Tax=Thalassobacterium maritimum TaxID=3041265 RepID=A0ABU1ASR3_9BACT|nr:(d)CMP kinase [Coraliomargarita sp. SDUM461003]MDQ8207195.1 (d)CMP kinase [Coraliomargarita sp. SDUM461003]
MSVSTQFKIIAMDGGAAVGKSSTSKGLATRLGLMHVDTGSHYRTLTYALLAAGADAGQPETIPQVLDTLRLSTEIEGRSARLGINGQVPADAEIRSPEVNANVSKFAAVPAVRQKLFDYQRSLAELAREHKYAGLIMEGRDIGSVIFPDAEHRFFLHADEATRSARRAKEGQTDSIAARDKMDSSRKTAPLVCPDGATQIDTGPHTLEEVIDKIATLIEK